MNEQVLISDRIKIKCRDLLTGNVIELDKPVLASIGCFVVVEHPVGTFSVTHRPSGWRATASTTERKAVAAMKKLHRLPIEWESLQPENAKEAAKHVRDQIIEIKLVAESNLHYHEGCL